MIPQPIAPWENDPCGLSDSWGLDLELSTRLIEAALSIERAGLGMLLIISGFRTDEQQAELLENPDTIAAPIERSTHTSCPATGADVWLASVDQTPETDGIKLSVILALEANGLRVGGGGPLRPNGIPVDWNHADLGPRV